MHTSGNYGYAILCVVLPMLWGLLIVGVVNWVETLLRLRKKGHVETRAGEANDEETAFLEYYI